MPPLSGNNRQNSPTVSENTETTGNDITSTERDAFVKSPDVQEKGSPRDTQGLPVAPDGGWGWMIVVAVFMIGFLVDGSVGSFGILYPELLRSFGAGPSVTSLAGSIIVAAFLMACPVAGLMLRRFSSRVICFIGGLITTAGFVVSAFSPDMLTFILSYGIMGGFGIGLNLLAGNILVNIYFAKRRGIACGIVASGAGFGVFVLAITTEKLLHEYGWRGTMLIIAGIMLHFCVFACLLRPLKPVKTAQEHSEYDSLLDADITSITVTGIKDTSVTDHLDMTTKHNLPPNKPLINVIHHKDSAKTSDFQSLVNISNDQNGKGKKSHLISLPDLSGTKASTVNVRYRNFCQKHEDDKHITQINDPFLRKDIFYSGSLLHLKEFNEGTNVQSFLSSLAIINSEDEKSEGSSDIQIKKAKTLNRFCDPALFCNPVYVPILLGAVLIQMGQFIPNTFIPEYCTKIGLSATDGSIIISILGAVNILGRLSAGCLANVQRFDSLWLCNFGVLMCAVTCALFPLCSSFSSLCAFAVGYGYFIGYFAPLHYLIIVDHLGLDKLTSAMGLLLMCKSPAALAGPPLAGCVYEWTKDYSMTIEFAAGLFLLAAIIQSMVPFTKRFCAMTSKDRMEISFNV